MLAASYLLGDTDSDLEDEIQEARDEPLHALQLDPQQVINTLFSNPNFLQVMCAAFMRVRGRRVTDTCHSCRA
jgi:hypothetical protein